MEIALGFTGTHNTCLEGNTQQTNYRISTLALTCVVLYKKNDKTIKTKKLKTTLLVK